MRELKLGTRSTQDTKDIVAAIAWACAKRGKPWKSELVDGEVYVFCREHGIAIAQRADVGAKQFRYAMKRLEKEGFADVAYSKRGRVEYFKFHDDVELKTIEVKVMQDHPTSNPVRLTSTETKDALDKGVVDLGVTPGPAPYSPSNIADPALASVHSLPLPPAPFKRYLAVELNALLDVYAQQHPEEYANWADRLMLTLKATLEK